MEYGATIPLKIDAKPAYTYVKASWQDVAAEKRDDLRVLRHWLQKDLGITFDIEFWREERDPLDAAASRMNALFQRALEPYRTPNAQTDDVAWAGQVLTKRPQTVRLNIDLQDEGLLTTLAHEARHIWQLANQETWVPRSIIKARDVEALCDLMEHDARSYASTAIQRWKSANQ